MVDEDEKLVSDLRYLADWAGKNQGTTPRQLADRLSDAAERLYSLSRYLEALDKQLYALAKAASGVLVPVELNLYDEEELHEDCTVQILRNTVSGELSVGWWENQGGGNHDDRTTDGSP